MNYIYKIRYKLEYYLFSSFYRFKFLFTNGKLSYPTVVNEYNTIEKIINDKVSVSRFGDGELNWILGENIGSFQKATPLLSNRLLEVLQSDLNNHIKCIPDVVTSINDRTRESKIFWQYHIGKYHNKWEQYSNKPPYYDTNFTRPYIGFKNKKHSTMLKKFQHIQKIWQNRHVLIIEGEDTRLGVGNNLFQYTQSVERILAPSTDAFDQYDSIYQNVIKYLQSLRYKPLVLIGLGPTATVLAFDLSKQGYQAIDIGHIDIEYEWFLMGATDKAPVPGKFVNEKGGKSGELDDKLLNGYKKEIVLKINSFVRK